MNTYILTINNITIATLSGDQYAAETFNIAVTLAEQIGEEVALINVNTGEIVTSFDPDGDDDYEDYYCEDCDCDCGFDPYMGSYTFDC